jgi:hypothetical protein
MRLFERSAIRFRMVERSRFQAFAARLLPRAQPRTSALGKVSSCIGAPHPLVEKALRSGGRSRLHAVVACLVGAGQIVVRDENITARNRELDDLQGLSIKPQNHAAARLLPEITVCMPMRPQNMPICRSKLKDGATGLEPYSAAAGSGAGAVSSSSPSSA